MGHGASKRLGSVDGMCCLVREHDGLDVADQRGSPWHHSLSEAIRDFRVKGSERLPQHLLDPQWHGACGLLQTLLVGPQQHLREVTTKCDVWACDAASSPSSPRLASFTVRWSHAPLFGEIATRSHLGCEIRFAQEVRFTLMRPADWSDSEPLVVEVEGFDFEALPEIFRIRQHLKSILGANYDSEHVYQWWLDHVRAEFPLETSKAHRILESVLGLRSSQLAIPRHVKVDAVWALVNAVSTRLAALEFVGEQRAGLRVTGRARPPVPPTSEEDLDRCQQIMRQGLARDQHVGDVFAPSAFNFMRFLQGHAVGQHAGSVAKLTKLFSAAHTWGPGSDGWHRYDQTWLAVDEKNVFGRTVKENGRILWRVGDTGTAHAN